MDSWTDYVLIAGAGVMGRAIAYDLRHCEPRHCIVVVDRDPEALRRMVEFVGAEGVQTVQGDAGDMELMQRLMSRVRVCIGALSYRLNLEHTAMAIHEGAGWVDLGGNNDVVRRQFELDAKAKTAGVTVIPDCGLAPGMVNVIAGDAVRRLERVDELHFRVGGLPQNPKPPLFYGLVFSPEGLANEYYEPSLVIEDGELRTAPPLTGWERVMVGAPYGTLEAFNTSGGSSTMVETFLGKVKSLDYKTLRYPGHLRKIKLLLDLGLFDPEAVDVGGGNTISPRKVLGALLERLGWVTEDVVVVKAWAVGEAGGKHRRIEYSIIDQYDPATDLTAMARTTGFSAVVIARMILDGRINTPGVQRQEQVVPPDQFFRELESRGIQIKINIVEPSEPNKRQDDLIRL